MKKKLPWIILVLFIGIGLMMGKNIGETTSPLSLRNNDRFNGNNTSNSSPTSVPWQENFVIVIVDEIGEQSKVNSVWLLMIDKEVSKRSMIAIYPQNEDNKTYGVPHDSVMINSLDVKSVMNMEIITSRRLQMDHILIVDETFVNGLMAMSGNVVLNDVPYETYTSVLDIAPAWEKPIDSLNNQIAVLINICGTNYGVEGKNLFQVEGLSDHVITTTSLSDLNARWNEMVLTSEGDYCEILIGS